jgi:F5/8 type C domain
MQHSSLNIPCFADASKLRLLTAFCLLGLLVPTATARAELKPLVIIAAQASSKTDANVAAKAIDGKINDESRWLSSKNDPTPWLELKLGSVTRLGGVHLFSGTLDKNPVENLAIDFRDASGHWIEIPSASVTGNQATALRLQFDQTVDVRTDCLRLRILKSHQGIARIKEITVWPYAAELPPLPKEARSFSGEPPVPEIYLNQSGFDTRFSKRFTAPTLPDGTPFAVRPSTAGAKPTFTGVIKGNIGDFTAFAPSDTRDYVVEAGGIVSVPFRIRPWWLERVSYQRMIDFMVDSRHYVGNDRAVCSGSFGWRDDHHFGWQLHTLVPQYLSNPSAYDRMPRQIRYEPPTKPGLWGALKPYDESAPDAVKLIHWGADVIVSQKLTHELLKSQLAYFLYAWPALKKYLPEQNYTVVRDYVLATWTQSTADRKYPYDASTDHNLLGLKTKIGSTKGELPPGFSVEPNILLYAAARRDHWPDSSRYLSAARAQAAWMTDNLDWSVPRLTKGQRMSEFITLTGLATFLRLYPEEAPPKLRASIANWTEVMVRRSNNLWDFRKLDDAEGWTPMEPPHPQKWNEPGNVAGLPAALLAVKAVTADPATRLRLDQIAVAHLDNVFGRNPVGRHFSYDAPREVEGVEHGWFTFCPGGIGRLAQARFVLDASPKDFHYPYNPEMLGRGYTEGWIQFNTPFNASMAYLAFDRTSLVTERRENSVVIRLCAPINFDDAVAETATVQLTTPAGQTLEVTVTEESPASPFLAALLPAAKVPAGSVVSYGFGYLGHSITVP